jgi:hypothetical protein
MTSAEITRKLKGLRFSRAGLPGGPFSDCLDRPRRVFVRPFHHRQLLTEARFSKANSLTLAGDRRKRKTESRSLNMQTNIGCVGESQLF